ncbi:hypothetical protein V6N13_108841 [Hibiscus sabdariffa]
MNELLLLTHWVDSAWARTGLDLGLVWLGKPVWFRIDRFKAGLIEAGATVAGNRHRRHVVATRGQRKTESFGVSPVKAQTTVNGEAGVWFNPSGHGETAGGHSSTNGRWTAGESTQNRWVFGQMLRMDFAADDGLERRVDGGVRSGDDGGHRGDGGEAHRRRQTEMDNGGG